MSPQPIRMSAVAVDLSPRVQVYTTVDASPSAASETTIATLTLTGFSDMAVTSGISISGWAAFTVGTSGTAVTFRIRPTSIGTTAIASTGALTGGIAAGNLAAQDIEAFHAAPSAVGVYLLTMQVTAGAAASTVSALVLRAIIA